jgi:tetratricopeptide (TPR) repeat protein
MNKKSILTLFPLTYWVILGIALLLRIPNGLTILSNQTINIVATLLFIRIGVIIHEIGHLIFAKISGGNPKRMILGKGHEVHRFEFSKIKIIINNQFKGGFAMANFDNKNYIKLRRFIYVAGGALTNFIFAYFIFAIFNFDFLFFTGKQGINISSAFISANFFLGFFSLIPYNLNYQGIKIPTDGLSLVKILFGKNEYLEEEINQNDFFEAIELFESKEYDKAIVIFERYSKIENTAFVAKLNIGIMHLKKGEFDDSLKIHLKCLELLSDEKNKKFKALLNNNLAWIYLLKQDFTKADLHSKTSFSINPEEMNFQGTRGSTLIEIGKIEQGINLLEPLVDFKYPNSQTLCASMYLYFGFSILHNDKKKNKYLNFVSKHSSLLDKDENQLWTIIKKRILENGSTQQHV